MFKKLMNFLHVTLALAAIFFLGYAFWTAVLSTTWGLLESMTIAAATAVMASICRDAAK
jgi:hypothetical protein